MKGVTKSLLDFARGRRPALLAILLSLQITPSIPADVLVLYPQYVFRYSENTGALISKTPRNFDTETVDSIVVGPDGDLFGLGNTMGWGAVFRFDGVTGSYKSEFIPHPNRIGCPASLRFGPNGDLYISAMKWGETNLQVVRYDGQSAAFKGVVISESERIEPLSPITFGPDGNLYIADSNRGILRYDPETGNFLGVLGNFRPGTNNVTMIHFGGGGRLYLVTGYGKVLRLDAQSGELIDELVDGRAAGMTRPYRAMFGPDGDIYLSDAETLNVWRFDGQSGASKGIFIQNSSRVTSNDRITAMTFFGPRLAIARSADAVTVRWPAAFAGFQLESRADLVSPWKIIPETPELIEGALTVRLGADSTNALFRLTKN